MEQNELTGQRVARRWPRATCALTSSVRPKAIPTLSDLGSGRPRRRAARSPLVRPVLTADRLACVAVSTRGRLDDKDAAVPAAAHGVHVNEPVAVAVAKIRVSLLPLPSSPRRTGKSRRVPVPGPTVMCTARASAPKKVTHSFRPERSRCSFLARTIFVRVAVRAERVRLLSRRTRRWEGSWACQSVSVGSESDGVLQRPANLQTGHWKVCGSRSSSRAHPFGHTPSSMRSVHRT